MMRAPAAIGCALLAGACQAPQPVPAAGAAPVATALYRCEDGRTARASYQGERATLEIDGRAYALRTAISGSGARYVGEGLQWWTKGLEHAHLSRLAPGEATAADPGVECSTEAGKPRP